MSRDNNTNNKILNGDFKPDEQTQLRRRNEPTKNRDISEVMSAFYKDALDFFTAEDRAFFDALMGSGFKSISEKLKNENELQLFMEKYKMKIKDDIILTKSSSKERSIVSDNKTAEDWYIEGRSNADLRQFDIAIDCYENAICLFPGYADAWNAKGECIFKLKCDPQTGIIMQEESSQVFKEEIKCFITALKLDSDCIDAWKNMGGTLCFSKQYLKALVCYNEALKREPDDSEAWFGKGSAHFSLEEHSNALTSFSKAVEIDPEYPESWLLLGVTHDNIGSYNEARTCFKKVLDIVPSGSNLALYAMQSMYSLPEEQTNNIEESLAQKLEEEKTATESSYLADALEKVHLGYGKRDFFSVLKDSSNQEIALVLRKHIHKYELEFFEYLLSFSATLIEEKRHDAAKKLIFMCEEAKNLLSY